MTYLINFISIFKYFFKNKEMNVFSLKKIFTFISNYEMCKKYLALNLDINNINLKKKIIQEHYLAKTTPSDFAIFFKNIHSDIEYERFSIFEQTNKIKKRLSNLNIDNKNFFKKRFSDYKKKINFFSFCTSFLAFNINLATIYSFFDIKCNIFYYHDGDNLFTKTHEKNDIYKQYIVENECLKISKKNKNINFIFLRKIKNKKKLSKQTKEEIKLISLKDITTYSQILTFKKKFKYSLFKEKIIHKSKLKSRYSVNLNFAKKIINFVNTNDFWLIHNSNLGGNGVLQKIINKNKLNFSSHEFTLRSFDYRKNFQNFTPIIIAKNTEVLKFEVKGKINKLINENNLDKLNFGSNQIVSRYKTNFNKKEIDSFYSTYPELKKYEKKKIFLLLGNVLSESRYSMSENHTIFKNFKEFISDTISFFNNSDFKLIIKCHPDELALKDKFDANLETLVNSLPQKNIYLIYGNQISSYSLLDITNNIIVYDTNMGAEANFIGKYVITCGESRYKHFDITYFPKDKLDYFNTLKDFNFENNEKMKNKFRLSKDRSSLFWYFYCLDLYKSFPFVYGDSTNQLNKNFKFFFSSECDENNKNLLFDLIDC